MTTKIKYTIHQVHKRHCNLRFTYVMKTLFSFMYRQWLLFLKCVILGYRSEMSLFRYTKQKRHSSWCRWRGGEKKRQNCEVKGRDGKINICLAVLSAVFKCVTYFWRKNWKKNRQQLRALQSRNSLASLIIPLHLYASRQKIMTQWGKSN